VKIPFTLTAVAWEKSIVPQKDVAVTHALLPAVPDLSAAASSTHGLEARAVPVVHKWPIPEPPNLAKKDQTGKSSRGPIYLSVLQSLHRRGVNN